MQRCIDSIIQLVTIFRSNRFLLSTEWVVKHDSLQSVYISTNTGCFCLWYAQIFKCLPENYCFIFIIQGQKWKITYHVLCSMLTWKSLLFYFINFFFKNRPVSINWQTHANKYTLCFLRIKCIIWLYNCALEINTGS